MARLYPSTLPADAPESERKVFSILKLGLTDDWVVVHGVAWQGLPGGTRVAEDREADFLVGHPSLGALLIEVKGGLVKYEEAKDSWTSRDRNGAVWEIKNPFRQARAACNSLIEVLTKTRRLPSNWGPFGWTVWFPDGEPAESLLELPDDVILTNKDLSSRVIANRIEHILRHYQRPGKRADTAGLTLIVNTVRHDFQIVAPFKVVIGGVERSIIELSQQQHRVLDGMRRNRRVAVEGCAGSGKTLLAVEQAKRLASQGLSTLLTCFNASLADYLQGSVGAIENLKIRTFFGIAKDVMDKARTPWPRDADAAFFKRVPDLVVTAIQKHNPSFDAIVVDEGQDFDQNWWYPLIFMLADPNNGIFYLFSDNNQSLYDRPQGLPETFFEFTLDENWRNTKQICEFVRQYYSGPEMKAIGPEGPAVEITRVASSKQVRDEVRKALDRICNRGEVDPVDVVVLTPWADKNSYLLGRLGTFNVTTQPSGPKDIRLATIRKFKGLDHPVVIVAGIQESDKRVRELFYVAATRARALLVCISVRE